MENLIAIFLLGTVALLIGERVFAVVGGRSDAAYSIAPQKFVHAYVQSNILTNPIKGLMHPSVAFISLSQSNFLARGAPVRGYYLLC